MPLTPLATSDIDIAERARSLGLGKPEGVGQVEHLITLLQMGAAIEHELMIQYLYAAYSLGGDQVPDAHRQKVRVWQQNVLAIAREEMGHLLTVQNVLTALGGPVVWDRGNYPRMQKVFPISRKALGPLTKQSLEVYIYAEGPSELAHNKGIGRVTAAQAKAIYAAASRAVGSTPDQVGTLYAEIIRIVKDPLLIPDSAFHAETYAKQASWEEWGKGYEPYVIDTHTHPPDVTQEDYKAPVFYSPRIILSQVASRTQVVEALTAISEQGENARLVEDGQPSHFERFVSIYDGWRKSRAGEGTGRSAWRPTRHVPVNPTVDKARKGRTTTFIESEYSREWGILFNLRYRLLLTYLSQMYRLPPVADPTEPQMRPGTLHRVFSEMYNLRAVAGILVRLPLTDTPGDERRAGPPFELPYTTVLPQADDDCWRLCRDLLRECVVLGEKLSNGAPTDAAQYLTSLRNLDMQSLTWLDTVIDARSSRRSRA